MSDEIASVRTRAFGQATSLSPVDRFGVWLSGRRIRHEAGRLQGKDVADIGCGFDATFARTIVGEAGSVTLVDVALKDDLKAVPGITAVEGALPDALDTLTDESFDVILCISVLEHLWDPEAALRAMRRLLRPGGLCLINVPTWRGKRLLEFSAFRLGLSPAEEMDDHKRYYDPHDLWPLLVQAGFRPQDIRCRRHKFGLNTFARCAVPVARP